jgi:hypothetical protein
LVFGSTPKECFQSSVVVVVVRVGFISFHHLQQNCGGETGQHVQRPEDKIDKLNPVPDVWRP